jgi:Fe-S-cluster containining protein
MAVREVRVLSFHAEYRCRNSGACCTANWPIPVEADRLARLQAGLAAGALRPAVSDGHPPLEILPDAPPETPARLAVHDGRCVFYDAAGSCEIHKTLGHDALPLACRQFPRVCVTDPRGVSVTLSHYCPTAAGLLAHESRQASASILTNAERFPPHLEYVGLDAAHALPPLLRPDVLMEWESWWEIERLSVEVLLNRGRDAGEAIARLRGAVAAVSDWSPGPARLIDRVHQAFEAPAPGDGPDAGALLAQAEQSVPEALRYQFPWRTMHVVDDRTTRRFLAAHAFANWAIHLGSGLESWLLSIETANALLQAGAGVRHADLILRHLIDHEPEHPST